MKKTLLLVVCVLISVAAFAQKGTGFGIRAGLNYSQNGDLRFADVQNAVDDLVTGSDGRIGFHVGFYGKLDFPKIYLKPELVYTRTKSNYSGTADYDVSKIDLPVLLGYKIIGPLSIFAGPAFQYTLDNDLDGFNIDDVENDFTVGLNIGLGVSLGKIGLDVRYERGFSENEANLIINDVTSTVEGRVDSRPSQIIFSASLKL